MGNVYTENFSFCTCRAHGKPALDPWIPLSIFWKPLS